MNKFAFIFMAMLTLSWLSCDTLQQIQKTVEESASGGTLSDTDIVSGLKQALEVGAGNAVKTLNKTDGFLKDPLVKIAFPPDAQRAADKLRDLGMSKLVDDFVTTLNRGAEKAAGQATPIFVNAVKEMTFQDARGILQGPDNAATEYFKGKTSNALAAKFSPIIKFTLDDVNATKYWTDITTTYNKIPFVNKVETDLVKYTTGKALDGLFLKLEGEEKKIRTDPAARVTELLRKVFGSVTR
ncbi:MAG: DUF4197 domain-containing protein [Bacteroidota bacterium]